MGAGAMPQDDRHAAPVDQRLGLRVRDLRIALGLTQAELGQALGVSFQQIQKYESGENRIAASKLLRLSRALGVSVAVLLDGVEAESDDGALVIDSPAVDLLRNYSRIESAELRTRIADLMKQLALATRAES